MENDELIRLLNTLPDGEWCVTRAEYADARTVLASSPDGRTLTVAADVTPESAAFLVAAKKALPRLLADITEERAYYARLEAENGRLHNLTHDLSSQLLDQEQEIYELSAAGPGIEADVEPGAIAAHLLNPVLTLTTNRVPLANL